MQLEIVRLARVATEALKTPDEWKTISGREWFERELAAAQRVVLPGGSRGRCAAMASGWAHSAKRERLVFGR